MDTLALSSLERCTVLTYLTAQRDLKPPSSSERLLLDGLAIKLRSQGVFGRIELFILMQSLRAAREAVGAAPEANVLDSVLRKLWDTVAAR